MAAGMAVGMAAPASADVDVTVTVDKTKTITVTETITLNKDVTITANVDRELSRAAEASAMVNHTIDNNTVDRNINNTLLNESDNGRMTRTATIGPELDANGDPIPGSSSVSGNTGVTGVNQDVGAMANQGNVWSVGITADDPSDPDAFADAQAEVDQSVIANVVDLNDGDQVLFTALIENSVNDNIGLTAVNQNAGNMNNQDNTVAAAAGLSSAAAANLSGVAVALAEAALGQETTGNTVDEGNNLGGTTKLALISGSVNENIGITQVNQSVGNMGNQGNVAAVGAALILAP
jgi:hypothetical protein